MLACCSLLVHAFSCAYFCGFGLDNYTYQICLADILVSQSYLTLSLVLLIPLKLHSYLDIFLFVKGFKSFWITCLDVFSKYIRFLLLKMCCLQI